MNASPTPITITVDEGAKRINEVVLAYRMGDELYELASLPPPAIGELRHPDESSREPIEDV